MNIREQLLVEHSKENTVKISKYIGGDKARLDELMKCFFSDTYRVSQRSAMVVSYYFDEYPQLMEPYLQQLIVNLEKENLHIAVKRNSVRILQFVSIPEQHLSSLFDRCLHFLVDQEEPIAVKAFSMQIVYNCCKRYPELAQEVTPIIDSLLEYSESKGILARGRKIRKLLAKL